MLCNMQYAYIGDLGESERQRERSYQLKVIWLGGFDCWTVGWGGGIFEFFFTLSI